MSLTHDIVKAAESAKIVDVFKMALIGEDNDLFVGESFPDIVKVRFTKAENGYVYKLYGKTGVNTYAHFTEQVQVDHFNTLFFGRSNINKKAVRNNDGIQID